MKGIPVTDDSRPLGEWLIEHTELSVHQLDASLAEDFFHAFAQNAGIDLHIEKRYGRSPHHVVEGAFKGVARALREAASVDPREKGLPTVKGAL